MLYCGSPLFDWKPDTCVEQGYMMLALRFSILTGHGTGIPEFKQTGDEFRYKIQRRLQPSRCLQSIGSFGGWIGI